MTDQIGNEQLTQYVTRIERLEEEKEALSLDVKEVYSELKGAGFDPKIVRKLVSLRKIEDHDRKEMEELIEVYKAAVGME